jgi:hypothetical protein
MALNHTLTEVSPGRPKVIAAQKLGNINDPDTYKVRPMRTEWHEDTEHWKIGTTGDHGLMFAPYPFGSSKGNDTFDLYVYPDVVRITLDPTEGEIPPAMYADPSQDLRPNYDKRRQNLQANGILPVHMILGMFPDALKKDANAHHMWARQLLDPAFLFAWEDAFGGWWTGKEQLIDVSQWTDRAVDQALLPELRRLETKSKDNAVTLDQMRKRYLGTKADLKRIRESILDARKNRDKVLKEGEPKLKAWLEKYK